MKLLPTFLSLLTFICFGAIEIQAQQVFKLNSMDSRSKQMTFKTISGADHLRQYYRLHDDVINFTTVDKGDYIEMESSPGSMSTFRVKRVENYTPTTTSFITRDIENPQNTFTFTYSSGRLHGIFHKSHEETYFFEYDKAAEQNYVAKSSSFYDDEQFCSVHEINHDIQAISSFTSPAKSHGTSAVRSNLPTTASMVSSLDDEVTIDVLFLYTEKAKTWSESTSFINIDGVIAEAMIKSQLALDNSQTGIKLRLVHSDQTNYSDDSAISLNLNQTGYVSAGDHLRRLTRNESAPFDLCSGNDTSNCQESDYDGYFPNAHSLRDQYGADVVAAILSEPNTGGIAWSANAISGSPGLAFSINRVQQIGSGYTLIHEIGHNMGNAHARNQSTAEANDFGGMFVYSTGNRFTSADQKFATVMAYNEGGYNPVAYFSNPDIELSGVPIGNPITSTSEAGPSDNARSMREIKRVVASYRSSVVDPPLVDVDVSSISADLNQQNSTFPVPITIQNNGASDLMWDFDFDIESEVLAATKQSSANTIAPDPVATTFSPGSGTEFSQSNNPGVIYLTSFESGEGFSTGDFPARVGWRSFSTAAPFEISSENPSDGSRHLRLPRRSEASGSMFSRSPFFGPQPMGEFSISFDIAVQDFAFGGEGEVFDVYVFDGSTGTISSGLIISGGNIFARSLDEDGVENFSFANSTFPTDGTYRNIEIRYNPNNRTVDYYFEGTQITSNPYPFGRKPDYMYFGHRNDVSGAYMDVDNIKVERLHSPFNWLTAQKFGGTVAPGESETVNLTLNAVDVASGTYDAVLQVRSNDPANPVLEVPISANIQMATTSEMSQDLPQRPDLAQNYPNPFNPTTTIQFTLNRASDVTLEVFNITGQRVATLVRGSLSAGNHRHTFDASGLSSGIYMYRLKTPEQTLTRQMILIK